jgi:hypothetical protein
VSLYIIADNLFNFYLPCDVDAAVSILHVLSVTYDTSLGVLQSRHKDDQEKDCWSTHNEGYSNKITKKNLNNGVVHFIH